MKQLYEKRIVNVRKALEKEHLDALLVTDPHNVQYITGFSIGGDERALLLVITSDDALALTNSLYEESISQLPYLSLPAKTDSKRVSDILEEIIQKKKIKAIGIEYSSLYHDEYERLTKKISTSIKNGSHIIERIRAIKTPDEIKLLTRSAQATTKLLRTIEQQMVREKGPVTEKNIQQIIRTFFFNNPTLTPSFEPIIAIDSHAAQPHYHDQTSHNWHHSMLIDVGVSRDGYVGDCTRVFFKKHALPTLHNKRMKDTYQRLLDLQERIIDMVRPGMTGGELHNYAVTELKRHAGRPAALDAFFTHALGHGVGLSVHELPHISPLSKEVLQPNMVFTIEPGLYFSRSFGLRIEDTVALTDKGAVVLTKFPKRLSSVIY